jgi:hypothetical protein
MSDRLSIVIATTHPWPEIRETLESLREQAAAHEAEILVVDGDGAGFPETEARRHPNVRVLKRPGASVFALRAHGISQSRGEVVAITEDHCRVPPDWCARILDAHRRHPEAAAIGGAVENGATSTLVDWANFALVFSPFMPPIQDGDSETIALQANISYKRRVLPSDPGGLGMMEMLFNQELLQRGERLVADGGILVHHHQSRGFLRTCASHFHNGRSIAGFRLADLTGLERLARIGSTAILPPFLLWLTLRNINAKGRLRGELLASVPLVAPLTICHAAGELIGYLAGPGDSPRHLD